MQDTHNGCTQEAHAGYTQKIHTRDQREKRTKRTHERKHVFLPCRHIGYHTARPLPPLDTCYALALLHGRGT